MASVPAPVRHRAVVPVPQTNAQLDDAADPDARAGRPLDVAAGGGVYPAVPGARPGGGPAPPVAAPPTAATAHPGARPARFCHAAARARHPGRRAKTLRAVARPTARAPLGSRTTLSGREEGDLAIGKGARPPLAPPQQNRCVLPHA